MTAQALKKWRIEKVPADVIEQGCPGNWFVIPPNPSLKGAVTDTHAEAVAHVSAQQKQAAGEKLKSNPKAALALLVLAGLAAAAKKGKKQ